MWGSSLTDIRGSILLDVVVGQGFIALNDGQPASVSTGLQLSAIQFVFPPRGTRLHWSRQPGCCGSDHLPIQQVL